MNHAALGGAIAVVALVAFFFMIRWLWRDTKARALHDTAQGALARFEDVRVTRTQLLVGSHHAPTRYPVHGVHATVETSGQIQRRITATRLATTGPFALAWQKKKDNRSVFLVVEGPGVAIVREIAVRGAPGIEGQARRFAAAVNAQAMLPAPATPRAVPAEPEDARPADA